MLAEAHPPSGPGRRKTLHHRERSNNSQNRHRADQAPIAPRSILDQEFSLGGDSVKDCTGSPSWPTPRTLLLMWSQREVIDYALQRRSTLQALRRPGRRLARQEACDADPMLIRAAKHHGEPSSMPLPSVRRG